MSLDRKAAIVIAALALAASACASDKATGGAAPATATGGDGVKTGPGVTETTITLSLLTDLTGPYASLGKSVTQAQQMYFEQLNAAGGVCGRTIETVVRDHGYDVQKAMAAYAEVAPRTAAIPQFIGSPMVTALKEKITADKILTLPNAWATSLLGSDAIQVTGTTYDVDMINAVDFLTKEKGIKAGDRIGHLYFEGDYGESALNGSKFAAGKAGLELVEQKIKATDQDMTAQATAFKKAGVNAILVSVGPRQAASLVGVALASGLDVPFVGSNSAYSPLLLDTPAAPALLKDYYVATAGAPISAPLPVYQKLITDYEAKFPGEPLDSGVASGYTQAVIIGDALKAACAAKDLSRAGIITAHRSQNAWEGGFGGTPMDFSVYDKPASLSTYIVKPDKEAIGGAVIFKEHTISDLAKEYQVPPPA
ncbi:ABC transporter substrate-binding protein [Herbidospora yilanensis]|uniref:ABC transporter substrate-binding protein n=1 Tax=Herbidospora yilanensis TaxID=354426 RepID=UPI0007846ECC|nr:ABC transporter substrate-binding protein [Herbidospora yilanensis]